MVPHNSLAIIAGAAALLFAAPTGAQMISSQITMPPPASSQAGGVQNYPSTSYDLRLAPGTVARNPSPVTTLIIPQRSSTRRSESPGRLTAPVTRPPTSYGRTYYPPSTRATDAYTYYQQPTSYNSYPSYYDTGYSYPAAYYGNYTYSSPAYGQ